METRRTIKRTYETRLKIARDYVTRAELARIKKLPRKSAMNRLRKIDKIATQYGGKRGDFQPTRSKILKERLNPIKGLKGVFLRFNRDKIKRVETVKMKNGKRAIRITGEYTSQTIPVKKIKRAKELKNDPTPMKILFRGRIISGIEMKNGKPFVEGTRRESKSGRLFIAHWYKEIEFIEEEIF